MKTITLSRLSPCNSFFRSENLSFSICTAFTATLAKVSEHSFLNARFEFSIKKPSGKGFRKVSRVESYLVKLGKKSFCVIYNQRVMLDSLGIKAGESFWMRVELS